MSIEETTVGDITDDGCEASSGDQRVFAFSHDQVLHEGEPVGCPAVQSDSVNQLDIRWTTAAYDDSVRELVDDSHTRMVVEEDVAKAAWKRALQWVKHEAPPREYPKAKKVAKELGWRE
jgi:hypothetical protein